MSIRKFSVCITAEDIYNKLLPEEKELFTHVKIINADICSKSIHIECLALQEEINECNHSQKLIGDWNISAF